MCLKYVEKDLVPNEKEVKAWKIVQEDGITTPFYDFVITNEFQESSGFGFSIREKQGNWREGLTTGFHVFKSRETARKVLKYLKQYHPSRHKDNKLIPVIVKNIFAVGIDATVTTITYDILNPVTYLAREIKLYQKQEKTNEQQPSPSNQPNTGN